MTIPTRIEVTLPVPPGMTETDHDGDPFEPLEVRHEVIVALRMSLHPFRRYVTVLGEQAEQSRTFYASDFPEDAEPASRYPHPGQWFEEIAAHMRASVGGA
jgi:hypothetical protein